MQIVLQLRGKNDQHNAPSLYTVYARNQQQAHQLVSLDNYTLLHTAKINTENSKQIFPEKEFHSLSPTFHIHVTVIDLYSPTIDLPILLQEIRGPILGIYKSLTGA